jgi:hypothetical protein
MYEIAVYLPEPQNAMLWSVDAEPPRDRFVRYDQSMDGIGIPILGGIIGFAALVFCLSTPRFKRFALAAFVSPLAASTVFLIGLFVLADMNPALEYGAHYIPTGRQHDPTALDNALWLASTAATFLFCGLACVKAQKFWGKLVERIWTGRTLPGGTNNILRQ